MRAHLFGLAVLTAGAALLATLDASAQDGKKKGTLAAAHAVTVGELFQTRQLLEKANHDYDGYRAKAVHQITKAMHQLHPNHKHPAPSINMPKEPPTREDQKLSDMQLAQAGMQLVVVLNQLSTLTGDKHAVAAVPHLQSAVDQLNTALKIR